MYFMWEWWMEEDLRIWISNYECWTNGIVEL